VNEGLVSRAELDSILVAVENPIRRRILRRLSEEPGYQLQLSKELGLSQQLVAKHLDSIEGAGLVTSMLEASPRGPKRKEYQLRKSVSITIDFAPSLFRTKVFSFGAGLGSEQSSESAALLAKMNDVLRYPDDASKIGPLAEVITEVDKKLVQMEDERAVLLYMRSLAIREATKASSVLRRGDRRKMLQHLLREQSDDIDRMSESLGMQATLVGDILSEFERDFSRTS
jgi:predicted transcriptional regulator